MYIYIYYEYVYIYIYIYIHTYTYVHSHYLDAVARGQGALGSLGGHRLGKTGTLNIYNEYRIK